MQRNKWSVFRKPQFFHTFSVILILSNYRKCMGKPRFSKNWSRTSLHRLSVLFLWTRKLLFSTKIHQIYEFRKKYLALNSNTNLLISHHLALDAHDATMSVNSSIEKAHVFLADKKVQDPTTLNKFVLYITLTWSGVGSCWKILQKREKGKESSLGQRVKTMVTVDWHPPNRWFDLWWRVLVVTAVISMHRPPNKCCSLDIIIRIQRR